MRIHANENFPGDAVVALSAARVGCAHVVTRNSPDFSGSTVPAVSPMELITSVSMNGNCAPLPPLPSPGKEPLEQIAL